MKRLKPEHWQAIAELAKPRPERKTIVQIAKDIGVSEQSIHNWKKDPLFQRELKKTMVDATLDRLPEVLAAVPDHIINDGNAAMFKTLLQAHDLLTNRVEIEQKADDSVDVNALKERLRRLKDED